MSNSIHLSTREISAADIEPIIAYWLGAEPAFLLGMGVDLTKMPERAAWEQMLQTQLAQPLREKNSYCIIWEADGEAVGHSNINKIIFGQEAYMHLHLWRAGLRQSGIGARLVRMTLPWFFNQFQLKTLFCEPYALNTAPNRTLEKVGFQYLSTQINTPGWINFEQETRLWSMTAEQFKALENTNLSRI
jgi:RimJ/RimL family protein N-acetyltransferase